MPPSKPQIEVRVQDAVTRVLTSGAVEDDLIECKSVWPDPVRKARQLAAMANRATPDPITWIIGIDEKAQTIAAPPGVEVSDWIAQLEKQFDGGAPALLHHFNVTVADGEQVTVLTFETDRAPYVVKSSGGTATREVPYRSGTGTRSASRAELLRMLAPTIDVPAVVILSARFSLTLNEPMGREPSVDCSGHVGVFVEHLADRTAMMPNHIMSGTLRGLDRSATLELRAWSPAWWAPVAVPAETRLGVSETKDGLLITAPGSGGIGFEPKNKIDAEIFGEWILEKTLDLQMQLGVTGVSRAIHLRAVMRRQAMDSTTNGGQKETRVSWLMQ
ncbi:hypothetical protein [Jiangella mangrovi]|uniref:Uncharacterized protein n=1 Tax=Jiangella mangrovi TaxID=1524084 RepID=A0A7W9GVK7_9ACTN|nr:hypothetical protein [Jiangella mangrovi]MBB5790850.1 hypothetical protein [Jiangella mangrovi]